MSIYDLTEENRAVRERTSSPTMLYRAGKDEKLAEEARPFVGRLAARPPLVTRTIKRTVYQPARSDLRMSFDLVPHGRSSVPGGLEGSLKRRRGEARAAVPGKVGEMRPEARLYRRTSAGDRKG